MMNEQLNQQIKTELDRQASALDALTASTLNRARQTALAQLDRPRRRWLPMGLAAGVATAALAMALTLPGNHSPTDPPVINEQLVDLELLTEDAELAMLDDLEFYLWVGAQLADETDPLDDPLG